MDHNEKLKLQQRYEYIRDAEIIELLSKGEGGLVEGAFPLLKEEALKRKLVDNDLNVLWKDESNDKFSDCIEERETPKAVKIIGCIVVFFIGSVILGLIREFNLGAIPAMVFFLIWWVVFSRVTGVGSNWNRKKNKQD